MKIGDLVTYKQRPDLQEFPCPWQRMGIIVGLDRPVSFDTELTPRCEVYWYGSNNKVWWAESQLELV
jgi:hypothetical protein